MMKHIYLGIFVILAFSSCKNLQPFTETDRKENNWTVSDLQRVQFYVSEDIKLQRKATTESSTIEGGRIEVVNGEKMEIIRIPAGTPGVVEYTTGKDNRLGISFEIGEDRYLMFGPNSSKGNRYYLLASDWKNDVGKVTYEGKIYFTSPESGRSYLMVDMRKMKVISKKEKNLKGRKVGD